MRPSTVLRRSRPSAGPHFETAPRLSLCGRPVAVSPGKALKRATLRSITPLTTGGDPARSPAHAGIQRRRLRFHRRVQLQSRTRARRRDESSCAVLETLEIAVRHDAPVVDRSAGGAGVVRSCRSGRCSGPRRRRRRLRRRVCTTARDVPRSGAACAGSPCVDGLTRRSAESAGRCHACRTLRGTYHRRSATSWMKHLHRRLACASDGQKVLERRTVRQRHR